MLMLNNFSGFGKAARSSMTSTLIDRTAGTNIGSMTNGGGLAAAFDGTTSQANAACAVSPGSVGGGYVGKTLAAAKYIEQAIVYASNDNGFDGSSGSGNTITITLYGKAGSAPATATDGTALDSTSFTDTDAIGSKTLISGNQSMLYDHVWVRIQTSHGTAATYCAELVLYELA